MTDFDYEAVEALAEALADVGGFGDAFRAEPAHPAEHAPIRANCRDTANRLLICASQVGFTLTRPAR